MADRNTLMMLEAIRLEIRAAAETVANAAADVSGTLEAELKLRADKLSRLSFYDFELATNEKEALGHDD